MKINKQQLDPELRKFYGPMKFAAGLLGRAWTVRMLNRLGNLTKGAKIKGLNCAEQWIPGTAGGPDIRVRIFGPANATGKLPGMLYIHGGGYITGSPESFLEVIHRFIATKPCIIVSPAYRRALDAPYPAAFDDCYATLLWMKANAETLGMIADKFIVAGHSAGGGLTAAQFNTAHHVAETIAGQLVVDQALATLLALMAVVQGHLEGGSGDASEHLAHMRARK